MPVPKYDEFMLPLLEYASDGKIHAISDARKALADYFQLTEEERKERLPSGRITVLANRVHWAKTYLKHAGLLEYQKRGYFQITQRGFDVLGNAPSSIDKKYLMRFDEFVEFQARDNQDNTLLDQVNDTDSEKTPDERLEAEYQLLRETVENELIDAIKNSSPEFFEKLVVELLVKMGYGGSQADAGQALGGVNDGGIDGVIKEDKLGLDNIYIQAKRWENTVTRPDVQKFAGALQGIRARKGIFITTSSFSQGAIEYADFIDSKIILIDGSQLAELMFDYDVGVSTIETYQLKRVDQDFFTDE